MTKATTIRRIAYAAIPVALVLLVPAVAAAAGAGGGRLPWDSPLKILMDDLTGPVAFTLGMLGFVCGAAALIWGGELGEFTRRMVMLMMVVSILVGVVNAASALGITGALV